MIRNSLLAFTTVTGGYIDGFKPVNDGFKCVIDRFKPVNVAPCDRSDSPPHKRDNAIRTFQPKVGQLFL